MVIDHNQKLIINIVVDDRWTDSNDLYKNVNINTPLETEYPNKQKEVRNWNCLTTWWSTKSHGWPSLECIDRSIDYGERIIESDMDESIINRGIENAYI